MAQPFTSLEQAYKWEYISNQTDGHYARARFKALKDEDNLVIMIDENEDNPAQTCEIIFYVRPDGSALTVDRETATQYNEDRKKFVVAPKTSWFLKNGQEIKVWSIDNALYVSIDGSKRMRTSIETVPARDAITAKENGIVAVLASARGNIALTEERKAAIEA